MTTILYKNPVALDSKLHAGVGLRGIPDLRFARELNAIPINLVEFPQAAKFYPIGFLTGAVTFPVAIVGLREENLFVDAEGRWKAGAYVPAFLRRYPFILGEEPGASRLALCVEDSPEVLTRTGGVALFADGQPTQATRQAMDFCNAYHTAGLATAAFSKAVVDAGLLVDREANAALVGGRKVKLEGFKIVDPDKLQSLPSKTLTQWNGRNWLAPLYAHVQSMNNWSDLLDLLAERPASLAR